MKIMKRVFAVALCSLALIISVVQAQDVDLSAILMKAYQEKQPLPVLSANFPELDVEQAYAVQKAYVGKRLVTDQISGFKAGLTSEGGQQRFGVEAPLAGVLFEAGRLTGQPAIQRTDFHVLMLETEIGFVIGEAITRPVSDVAELKKYVRAVAPAIELPDLGYADMKQLKGVDIIATNVAARSISGGEGA